MKLGRKFHLLIVWLVIQLVILSAILIFGSAQQLKLKDYQYKLTLLQYNYEKVSGFTNRVKASSTSMTELYPEWERLIALNAESFDTIINGEGRKILLKDLEKKVGNLETVWKLLEDKFNQIGEHFYTIVNLELPKGFEYSVSSHGLLYAIDIYKDDDIAKLRVEMNALETLLATLQYTSDSLVSVIGSLSAGLNEEVLLVERIFRLLALCITVFVTIIMVLIVSRITGKITRRIKNLQRITALLAQKDFTVRIKASEKDEVGELQVDLNNAISNLNEFFLLVQHSSMSAIDSGKSIDMASKSSAAAIHQIDSNINSLTNQFDSLNNAVERTNDALMHMSAVSKILVEDNHKQFEAIEQSNTAVESMAKNLSRINSMAEERTASAEEMQLLVRDGDEKISATNQVLEAITSQLGEVSDVVTIINAISEQTNLLSMNAAIESAHAGEAGKGFGVVAEEIRSLAESTGENAKRISTSIYAIIDKVNEANVSSNNAQEAFRKVSTQATEMLASLKEISASVSSANVATGEISNKTAQITASAEKINNYCGQLSEHQSLVSNEMSSMNNIFKSSAEGISEIREGTADIVKQMADVSDLSTQNFENMSEVGTILSEFKTVKPEDEENLQKVSDTATGDIIEEQVSEEKAVDTATVDKENPADSMNEENKDNRDDVGQSE
ncbi:MAG: methyl-accepting chemotaxis protein [Treponema sp.]|nr:methyl-accepting chemotaxis protein [Treponema sp.]